MSQLDSNFYQRKIVYFFVHTIYLFTFNSITNTQASTQQLKSWYMVHAMDNTISIAAILLADKPRSGFILRGGGGGGEGGSAPLACPP